MQLDTYEEVEPFLDGIEAETDRACAVLAGVLLDELLKHLLQRVMIEGAPDKIFKYPAALSTYSAKIDAAYYFSHLSHDEHGEISRLRKIRNEFAHNLDPNLSFNSPEICKFAFQLRLPALNVACIGLTHGVTPIEMRRYLKEPRAAFICSTRLMVGIIQRRAREYERPDERSSFDSIVSQMFERARFQQRWGELATEFQLPPDDQGNREPSDDDN